MGIVLSSEIIGEYVWGSEEYNATDVRMAIKKLRDKTDKELIVNYRAQGYGIEKRD